MLSISLLPRRPHSSCDIVSLLHLTSQSKKAACLAAFKRHLVTAHAFELSKELKGSVSLLFGWPANARRLSGSGVQGFHQASPQPVAPIRCSHVAGWCSGHEPAPACDTMDHSRHVEGVHGGGWCRGKKEGSEDRCSHRSQYPKGAA